MSGYSYIKTMTLMLLFHYCTMGSVDKKCFPLDNTFSGNARHLSRFKRHAREWIANKRSRHGRISEDIMTSDTVGCGETTLDSLKTIPKENCTATGFSIIRLNPTYSATQSCSSRTAGSGKNYQLTNCTDDSARHIEGLVSFPDSQVTIRNDHNGPVILAFTNNYKKSVVWALKTNAIRRLAAFPTTGIIPPSETVQIKINLIGQTPKKNLKDRLSLEYFVTDQEVVSDGNYYNFFHHSELTRMKKCLEVIYVQQ